MRPPPAAPHPHATAHVSVSVVLTMGMHHGVLCWVFILPPSVTYWSRFRAKAFHSQHVLFVPRCRLDIYVYVCLSLSFGALCTGIGIEVARRARLVERRRLGLVHGRAGRSCTAVRISFLLDEVRALDVESEQPPCRRIQAPS